MVMQVITVTQAGEVSGLQVKPGKGVDLRQFGKAKIVRASEIVWNEDAQAWMVVIQDAPGLEVLKCVAVTYRMAVKAGDTAADCADTHIRAGRAKRLGTDQPLLFRDYDDAVDFEIEFLNAHRLAGRY